jgi:hypothetical protein
MKKLLPLLFVLFGVTLQAHSCDDESKEPEAICSGSSEEECPEPAPVQE